MREPSNTTKARTPMDIPGYVKRNRALRLIIGMTGVLLALTVSLWGPVFEWLLEARSRYRAWRGGVE